MTLLEKALNTIKNLRGQDVEVFGQPYHIDNINIEYNDLILDVLEVFENLKDYEITKYDYYNPETDEYEEIEFNSSYDFIIHMEDLYGIEETRCDNSYNWGSPISNNFYFNEYYNSELDEYYYVVGIHKYGDVRGNYTDSFVLKFDNDYEFLELLDESSKFYTLKDKEGNDVYFDLRIVNEGLTCAEDDSYYYQDLNLLDYDSLEDLQKDILNL